MFLPSFLLSELRGLDPNDACVWVHHRCRRLAHGLLRERFGLSGLGGSLVRSHARLPRTAPEDLARRTPVHPGGAREGRDCEGRMGGGRAHGDCPCVKAREDLDELTQTQERVHKNEKKKE